MHREGQWLFSVVVPNAESILEGNDKWHVEGFRLEDRLLWIIWEYVKTYQEANTHNIYEQYEYTCDPSMFSHSDVCNVYQFFDS